MKVVKVVCGIIWKGSKVFIARRKPEKLMGGYWEFPGGKIEANENPEEALVRELKEELGMKVLIKGYFGTNTYQYESFKIELIAYKCEFVSATFKLMDHSEYCFVKTTELIKYELAPADLYILKKLLDDELGK
jgi:8-oxo-dGTP diphosphatase